MTARTLAHYRIGKRLGGGGMGVVYQAEDTRLRRSVALKFLPPELTRDPEAKERFVREARAASALDHPNICTIYEIAESDDGELYIAMAYYRGETLKKKAARGPMDVEEAVDVARQVAAGLAKAHAAGIVHRDVKPANVFVTFEGTVKVLDFGLAKTADAAQLTRTGSSMGTPAYRSPEQTRGEDVDARTDLWSLGVVLFELLSGQRPFGGDYEQAVVYSILNTEPPSLAELRPEVPAEVVRLVERLLAKDPAQRPATAAEVVAALDFRRSPGAVGPPASEDEPPPAASVAVLPFVNLSADPENEYFSDGLAEDVILALGRIRELRVPARSSSFAYRDKGLDGRAIGRELGVEAVLEGSVRRAGNRLRLNVELIAVGDGFLLWSERFDRILEDVFAIQDEISQAVVERLKVELLGGSESLRSQPPTASAEAYDLYLQGRYQLTQRTLGSIGRAVRCFEQATVLDPIFALAFAGLAESEWLLGTYLIQSPVKVFPRALSNARKAIEIDGSLAEAHCAMALVRLFGDWDFEAAERGLLRAIELNPRSAPARSYYAMTLAIQGRDEEALQQSHRALAIEPFAGPSHNSVINVHLMARRFDAVIEACYKTMELFPDHWVAHTYLATTLAVQARLSEAWEWYTRCEEILSGFHCLPHLRGYLHALGGAREEARLAAAELEAEFDRDYYSPTLVAGVFAALGDVEGAKVWVRKAVSVPDPLAFYLLCIPWFDPLREDPEFLGLLREIGLRP